jgi:hypothetical protein
MVRKVVLAIAYFIAIVYVLSIVLPAVYCFQHGCRGPELDGFMPAFLFTPLGALATAVSLTNSVQNIRKKESGWVYWPLAIVFSIVLLGVIALIVLVIYHTALRR